MNDVKKCYICGMNGSRDRLEYHHIFGGARRKLSEKYGLVVPLCGERCHRNGKYSAHRNAETALYLHQQAQRKLESSGMSRETFIKIFGKNYL